MKKVVLLIVLVVAFFVPAMIHAQGLVEYEFAYCSQVGVWGDFPLIPGEPQIPGDGGSAYLIDADQYINIIVDEDCYISSGVIVYGGVYEPDATEFSIYVDPASQVYGNIEERGDGNIWMTVGHGNLFQGLITEEGSGDVLLAVDGTLNGRVEEMGEGSLAIDIYGGEPEGGPGAFIGSATEMDQGDAHLYISIGEDDGLTGKFFGSFRQENPGTCGLDVEEGAQLPRGSVCRS